MKINDILECFNKVLDLKAATSHMHYVAHSTIEKKMGPVKKATTIITLCDHATGVNKDIISESYTTTMPSGQENVLIEETERRALTNFIRKWNNDTGITE